MYGLGWITNPGKQKPENTFNSEVPKQCVWCTGPKWFECPGKVAKNALGHIITNKLKKVQKNDKWRILQINRSILVVLCFC